MLENVPNCFKVKVVIKMIKLNQILLKTNRKLREENARLHNLIREKDNIIIGYQTTRSTRPEVSLNNSASHAHSGFNQLTSRNTASVIPVQPIKSNDSTQNLLSSTVRLCSSDSQLNGLGINGSANTSDRNNVLSQSLNHLQTLEAEVQPNRQSQIPEQSITSRPNSERVNSRQQADHNAITTSQQPQTVYVREQILESLPQFDGSSRRKWIFFEKTYQHLRSKSLNNDDLINQFKMSLEGQAYQLVEDLLLTRADSQLIIETLKEQYGDYNRILIELSREIINMKSLVDRPKHEVLELAIKLKAFVTHAKAYERSSALNDLFLCEEVLDKLKPEFQDIWGRKIRTNPDLTSNVEELSKFLFEIARLPSCQRPSTFYSPSNAMNIAFNNKNTPFTEEKETKEKCLTCNGRHALEKCLVFLNSSLPQRYNLVNANNICSACLRSTDHVWQNCPFKKICQLSGCTNNHHRLLHRFVSANQHSGS